ncbi:ankyrin repeat domain-containing protein [Vreelandella titanicae]|uniref:ankyrin repeat domain-containing protein n=1 Tax=Vreelandella titanicae TaxID=664683 RepID=UPI0003478428|nr:ankyrin repeat domain-containing protein [Halomonas titanicae]
MSIEDVFQAIRLKNYQDYLRLIDGVDVNAENEDGQTLLHEAAAYNSLECARDLISRGADVDSQDPKEMVPLHYAAANGAFEVAEILAEGGANFSISDKYGNEPLWTAVFNARGNYKTVDLFVRHGANPNHKNDSGKSQFDFAKQIKDFGLITMLENE